MPREVPQPASPGSRPGPARIALLVLASLVLALAAGCGRELRDTLAPNQRPTVRLTYAPVDTTQREFYVYRMYWTGFDADGRVVRYEYAVDPPGDAGADTQWVGTTQHEQTFTFTASRPESLDRARSTSLGFHVFVIRAVDNRGLRSEPAVRAFCSFGVAPMVRILEPVPSSLISPSVPPTVRITWTGVDYTDPYGAVAEKPLYYKYKLFKSDSDPRWMTWLSRPDTMRAWFAPAFAGWDSTGPDSEFAWYRDLVPNGEYLFVVVAFGRSGAYSPVWTLNTNMLKFHVGSGGPGPVIRFFDSWFDYQYPCGGFPWPLDPSWALQLQLPADVPFRVYWSATTSPGATVTGYRWALDLADLEDETPRSGPGDVNHWSEWSLGTSATVGPFTGAGGDTGEVHDFYLEARDSYEQTSLGWIRFRVFRPTFDRELLIVNDTRFNVDMLSRTQPPGRTDSLAAPAGPWPTRAELDTFLFAVGGVPWRMTVPGLLSPTGIFHGYDFDTLGTRYGLADLTIPLNVLGQYRHVVWMTDASGSRYDTSPTSATLPMTTLRYMSMRNRQNTLATWVQSGGRLWALGGGFGNATNAPWNVTCNDLNGVRTYSSLTTATCPTADLGPGRFMYDLTHWRSEFRVFNGFIRFARYDQPDPTSTAPGAWPGRPLPDPRYAALPAQLLPRSPATDPPWPFRSFEYYYPNNPALSSIGINIEYLTRQNRIIETVPVTPDSSFSFTALDTLYNAYGPAYQSQMLQAGQGVNGLMTHYHGNDNGPVTFLGTSIWDHRRTDCQALVDVVLGAMWGLPKNAAVTAPARRVASRR